MALIGRLVSMHRAMTAMLAFVLLLTTSPGSDAAALQADESAVMRFLTLT